MDTLRYTYNVDGSYIYISSRWTSPPVPSWTPTDGSAPLGVYFVGSFSSLKGAAAAAGESVGLRCFLFFFLSYPPPWSWQPFSLEPVAGGRFFFPPIGDPSDDALIKDGAQECNQR